MQCARAANALEHLPWDLRHADRMLRHRPGFSATVLALAWFPPCQDRVPAILAEAKGLAVDRLRVASPFARRVITSGRVSA